MIISLFCLTVQFNFFILDTICKCSMTPCIAVNMFPLFEDMHDSFIHCRSSYCLVFSCYKFVMLLFFKVHRVVYCDRSGPRGVVGGECGGVSVGTT